MARYPETGALGAAGQQEELIKAIAERVRGGKIANGSRFDTPGSVVAHKRLATYPVYVAIGRTKASILREWLEATTGYVLIAVPAVLGFILLNLLALRRTQREQTGSGAGARRNRPACRPGRRGSIRLRRSRPSPC